MLEEEEKCQSEGVEDRLNDMLNSERSQEAIVGDGQKGE